MSERETGQRVAVLVCVAEPLLAVGVRTSLVAEPDIQLIDSEHACGGRNVDVLVADTDTAAALALDRQRQRLGPRLEFAAILAISAQAREHAVRCALEQGIRGLVLTRSPVHDLLAGVRALASGGRYLCPQIRWQMAQVSQREVLTSREDEVLRLLTMGLCNKSIARDLEIAVGTVKAHVKSIMGKLDASCRTEAARIATERGLMDLPAASSRRVKSPGATNRQRRALLSQPFLVPQGDESACAVM
ncbi:response regulator transcription factor [Paraburkholderia oxyphila]|uniref:response regulator transcription factor n=1 Tax=Paraburkholderia oxyphila TaxID=614212 RepID=UPI0006940602|nr:response regulator transcription factor [Paraburkholderia oxyphila]